MQTCHCLIISHITVLEGSGFHKLVVRFEISEAARVFTELPVLRQNTRGQQVTVENRKVGRTLANTRPNTATSSQCRQHAIKVHLPAKFQLFCSDKEVFQSL